jgi:hypothetical protein
MAVLLPSVATACKGMLRATNASSFFFSPVFKEVKTQGRYAGVRARLGGDGDINLNGAAVIAEDFYSVLGLVIMSQAAVSRNLSFVFVGILFI